MARSSSAPSSFKPPRLTNFCARLLISMRAFFATGMPAFSARRCAERGGGFLDGQNVVRDLECPADGFTEAAEATDILGTCAGAQGTSSDGSTDQRRGFRAVNVLEHLRIDRLAFGFDVRDLAADHSVDGPGGSRDF